MSHKSTGQKKFKQQRTATSNSELSTLFFTTHKVSFAASENDYGEMSCAVVYSIGTLHRGIWVAHQEAILHHDEAGEGIRRVG